MGGGQAAFIQFDWAFRYQNMRYHTLLHIISGYLYRITSSGIMSDHARLEVEFQEDNVPSEFDPELITQNIRQLIKDDFPVTTETVDRNTLNEEDLIRTYTNLIPGQEYTDSVRTAPPSSEPSCRPITVATGSMAFLRAWRLLTFFSGTPFALAVRI